MENKINSRVIIAVNKRNKLLGYLRKLNSREIEAVSVKIFHTSKEKPINLFFVRSGAEDNFLVYAGYGKADSKKVVVLGSATIKTLWSTGFTSADNKESRECVAIDVFAKEYALDFKELQDVLFSIQGLSTYGSISTSSAILVELKPENKRIISYEVSMLPNNPLEPTAVKRVISMLAVKRAIDSATDMVHSAEQNLPSYACHSKDNNNTVTESERYMHMREKRHMLEALKRMHNTDSRKSYNIESELIIASSMLKSDLEKPLKRWKKILKAKPIEILTHISLRAGHVLDFYIREVSIGIDRDAYTGLITRYELIAKYSLNNHIVNKGKQEVIISGFVFKALHNAYTEYKQRKSENLDISHLESLLEKNQKASNQKRDKDLIGIIAETLREIGGINKTNISKRPKTAASEDLFCKKIKVNSKKDNNTTRPHNRPYQVPNPVVTILTNDESKEKVKEIIEEANKAKSFPYMLDYDNNCVVKISDNLFDILECRNKLEDILKIRKDIDVGIFALESPYTVFKKLFNISSLTVYHSASKNLYALIGA